jgi:hypothetical protein
MPDIDPPDQPLVTRADIDRLVDAIAELTKSVERLAREHQTQVTRTGQLQADIDLIRAAWTRIKPPAA